MNNTDHIDGRRRLELLQGAVMPEDFPQRLERLKEASGLSWRGLARSIGIDYKLMRRWRKGAAPSGGSMLSLFLFANRIGCLHILLGEGLQMTLFRS
ncbi:MAG: hypothetical protein F4Y02_02090 [Chloroflexi bacterium]|nr:hypothetical protein [Chloroflexota bacterium]